MATIDVGDREVHVRLTPFETLFALRGDLSFPRRAVTSVERFDVGLDAVEGFRAAGLAIPGRIKIGTWRRRGGKELVVVRTGEPAIFGIVGLPTEMLGTDLRRAGRAARTQSFGDNEGDQRQRGAS